MKIKKLDRFETHDRLKHFTNQEFDIGACCQSLIDQKPFGDRPFYIFAHPRTMEDGVTKKMIWQPRLTKPRAEPNSMLFKGYPNSDHVKIIWILPRQELWSQFEPGKMTFNATIWESITNYNFNKKEMEQRDPEDLSDKEIDAIYQEIARNAKPMPLES